MILLVDGITYALHQQLGGRVHNLRVLILIIKLIEKEPHGVDPSAFLVVALDRDPLRVLGVGGQQHRFLGFGVVVPAIQRVDIHGGQFPTPYRVDLADGEPGSLLLWVTENQSLVSEKPLSISICSNKGVWRRNWLYS